ncbi:carbohydrate sulfotransferase 3a [Hippocampus zosterae]|uniref:carbohydrate sulfotransferase 3a n=1 Tax=Hippocampus zosterae TaxID=109293 RepID=UPI00223D8FB1|nr:carbohydrate sulfotransferase 3a [Hippocampus zosterae]
MKIKYAVVFVFIVALVIIEKESNIISRMSDKMMQRQTPPLTTQSSPDYSKTTPKNLTALDMLLSRVNASEESRTNQTEERREEELQNGGRKNILLMATTRSGSSFMGEVFNQHGKNMFYLFEPLWHVQYTPTKTYNSSFLPAIYRDVLQGLFLCDFSLLEKFLYPPPQDHVATWLFRRYSSLSLCEEQVCTPFVKEVFERFRCPNQQCGPLNLTLASQLCLSKQYQAIKTVRVHQLEMLRPLVEDPRLNVKIIQLVRDPRAILASRMVVFSTKYQTWKSLVQDGQVPENNEEWKALQGNCDNMKRSAELGLSQPRWLRKSYMLMRYEDVTRNPMERVEEMYRFTGIPFSPEAREWILRNTQTTQNADDFFSTQRNSSEQAEKWRYSIPFTLAQAVQRLCGPTMKLFGYKFVDDAKMLVNKSVSLCEDKTFH